MCINTVYNYYKIALNVEKIVAKKCSIAAVAIHEYIMCLLSVYFVSLDKM